MKDALFSIFKLIWKTEKKPKSWRNTEIIQLFKGRGKGSMLDLNSYRNLHTKIDTRKLFGDIVITAAKEKIIQGMTKFQIGGVPGHQAQEHIFTLKSIIAHYEELGKGLILNIWDISKLFDSENLRDCMCELFK